MTESTDEGREGRVVARVPEDSYANRLILARAHAGHLSQRAAAERCGLNDANWANWERGMRSRTMVEDAEAIAEGLAVDRDWLLHGGPLASPDKPRRLRVAYWRRASTRPGEERRPRRIDRRDRITA